MSVPLFENLDYVIVMVSNMDRSVQFYRDQLGLRLSFQSPEWSEFETGRTVFALHGGGTPSPASSGRTAGTASIGFYVENLEAKFGELRGKGVAFTMPPTDREEEGIKLAVCVDPDGLPISIAQRKS